MPLVNKLSSGKIYSDDFTDTQLNPIWQASPTDPSRYSLTDRTGYLRLKHGDTPLYLFMDVPNRDFVFEIQNDYAPIQDSDTAGIVAYRDTNSRIELLEYFNSADNSSVTYTHMRMQKKGELYTGYGSKDNGKTWEIIGASSAQDITKVGLVINGPQIGNAANVDIDYVRVFESSKIVISNLTPGMEVRLIDADGVIVESQICQVGKDNLWIDLATRPIPFTGQLSVLENGIVKETSPTMDIWGGDTFWYGLLVEVYHDNTLVPKDIETQLGHMINGIIEDVFVIKNPGEDPITNVKAVIAQYFDYQGFDWVEIAEDIGGSPGAYSNEVFLGLMQPAEERKVWIKVTKSNPYTSLVADHKFLLEVTC